MNTPFKRDKNRVCRQYPARLLSGRYAFYSLSLFLLGLLALVSACGTSANTSSANAVSSPSVVSSSTHASITNVAATGEVVYLAESDGSITARQAKNGTVIWHQANLPILPKDYVDLAPAGQVLYDAYETTATTSRIEARQISNGMVIWSQAIPHHLGPGFVAMMVDSGMIYINTTFSQNHGLLYALRASDGQIRWQYLLLGLPMDASVYANNGIVAVLDNPETGSIHALHGNDGSPLLSYTCSPEGSWRPAVDASAIYIYCRHRPLQAFRVTDGTLLWTDRNSSQGVNYWRENQGVIYNDTGTMLQAFCTQDGTLLWQTALPSGTFGPSLQNQLVAVMTQNFVIMVFHASDGLLAWKKSLDSTDLNPTPGSVYTDLDANGFFLFGNQQTIHVWRSSDGRDIWHGTTASPIVWQPRVVNGRLYLWQFDGTLEVIDLQQGSVLWRYSWPPAQTQQCGTISTANTQDARLAQAVGVCFWKAFQQCNPATLTYIGSDQEVRTFTIKKTSSKCMILDTVQPGTATTQRVTYTCSDVQAFRGGNGALMFINCGSDGSITVPVNQAIQ